MSNPDNKTPVTFLNKVIDFITVIFTRLSKLFDRIVFHKTGSVIISLILSIMICVVIDYEEIRLRFFNDTSMTEEITDVPVEVLFDPEEYSVEGIPSQVTVSVTGESTDIQMYRRQSDVKVIADVRQASEGVNIIDLNVDNLPSKLSAQVSPPTVEATVSKKVTKQFVIQTDFLVGSNQKISDFETPVLDKTTVSIRASSNRINSIRSVKAIVDATGQVGDFVTDAALVAYDAKGNKVAVEITPATVKATVKLKQKQE